MTPSVERRFIDGAWRTVLAEEGGATGLAVESFTVTAAEISAAFDGLLGGSNVECLALGAGGTAFAFWYATTLDDGDVGSLRLAPPGLTTAQVNDVPDEEFPGGLELTTLGTYSHQAPFLNVSVSPVLIVSDCAGYLTVGNGPPASGQLTGYVLVQRAA